MKSDFVRLNSGEVCCICGGTGWADSEDGGDVRRCECYKKKRFESLLKKSRIPERYKHCRIDNFNVYIEKSGKKTINRGISIPLEYAKNFVNSYPDVEKGVLLTGKCGVGKTHLGVAILMELLTKKGAYVVFYDWRDLMKDIQACYALDTSEKKVLSPAMNCDVLCLDELGAKKVSEFFVDTLTLIINRRYNQRKVTIITSNWVDNPKVSMEESLAERIGYNLRSRLYEMCYVFEMNGEDYRAKQKNKII